jgi:hypothetical protein
MTADRDGVDEPFASFQVLGGLKRLFEGTQARQRLRRAGFEQKPRELRSPFLPNAFFGDIVLTGGWLSDDTAGEARCVFYSGIVLHALSECVVPRLSGRPEMQVGFAFTGVEHWTPEDRGELQALQRALSPAWGIEYKIAGRRKSFCLIAREDALHVIERIQGDRLALTRLRNDFFGMRWADLAEAPESAYEWLKRKT